MTRVYEDARNRESHYDDDDDDDDSALPHSKSHALVPKIAGVVLYIRDSHTLV